MRQLYAKNYECSKKTRKKLGPKEILSFWKKIQLKKYEKLPSLRKKQEKN